MKIIVPTRGRLGNQQTLKGIPVHLHRNTIAVCPEPEADRLSKAFPEIDVWIQPDPDMTITKKREWIINDLNRINVEKILMLDDDLFFYVRREDVPDRLRDADDSDVSHWFAMIEQKLSPEVPHAGFGPRQGNQNFPTGWHVGRMMLALGYHVPTVVANAELGRIETREDMDISLQLLRRGLPNGVCHEFAVGQKSYSAPGGCTGQRTLESSNADAHRLAELHPGLVRVVQKEYKGHPREEVVVQWKKALQQGTQWRNNQPGGVQVE